jgi:hypothetical protein
MTRTFLLFPMAATLLGACADAPSAPSDPFGGAPPGAQAVAPALATIAREQGSTFTCVATATTSGYAVTIEWTRAMVRNVSLITEDGTTTTALDHPRRRGAVTLTPSAQPLGYRLDDGRQILVQGGCAAP